MADVAPVVPPVAAPAPTAGDTGRTRRQPWHRGGRGGRGGRGNPTPPGTKPKEKTIEEKTGIPGIPSFCTPAENGDKARFDKVRSLLKSHVVQNLYRGKDVAIILSSMTDAVLAEPQELSTADEASKLKVKLWNMEVEEYVLQKGQLEENKVILHTIIWEQCTKSLRIKLKGTDGYEAAKEDSDSLWLLKTIRGIALNYESTKPKLLSLDDSLEQYLVFRQEGKSNDDYFKAFNGLVSVYEHLGGTLTHGNAFDTEIADIVAAAVAANAAADIVAAKKRATATVRDKVLATSLIKRSGPKYAVLRRDLANAYALGDDKYPSDLTSALGILNAYIGPTKEKERERNDSRREHQFAQVSGRGSAPVAGTNGRIWDGVSVWDTSM